ncbi:hypothetical protein ILUMI_25223 [Ignelater luminosus]|uniref:Retrotransposon gag domain-containing protein n=1 Tax=Ignelater luminosus TaxID=2038154 RepID=A0A8K0CAY0_IGNLU|nr:hypothetical protein ILUMI_25223 [Ignelater luminosus]
MDRTNVNTGNDTLELVYQTTMQQKQRNDESQQAEATGQNDPNSPTPQGHCSNNRISDSANTITNHNVMTDMSKNVGKFDGEKGPNIIARMWLQQIENVATIYKWPDAYTYQVAISSLTGAASHWYSGKTNEVIDWLSFKLAFCKTFTSEPSRTDLWERMVS